MRPVPGLLPAVAIACLVALAPARAVAQRTSISFLHTPPEEARRDVPLRLTGNVFGAGDMDRAILHYRSGPAAWRTVDFRLEGADSYVAVVPGEHLRGDELHYWVEALDFFGDARPVFAGPDRPARITVASGGGSPLRKDPPPPVRTSPPPKERRLPPPARADPPAPEASAASPAAARAPEPVPPSLADPSLVLRLEREQIRAHGLRTLADVMKLLPGFDTSRDVEGFWRVASRGRRSDGDVRVEWDGLALNNPYDGRVNWELPVEHLERIEVRRTPFRAGDAAFTTLVRLVPTTTTGVDAAITGGAFGTFDGHVRGGAALSGWLLSADAAFARRDGYQRPIARDVLTTDPDSTAGVTDDRRTAFTGGLALRRAFGEGLPELRGHLRGLLEERGALVGAWDAVGPGSTLGWGQLSGDLGLHLENGGWTVDASAYAHRHATDRLLVLRDGVRLDDPEFPNGLRTRTVIGAWATGLDASIGHAFGTHALTLGLRGELQRIDDFSFRANVNNVDPVEGDALVEPRGVDFPQKDPARANRTILAASLEDDWRVLDVLRLVAGVRFDLVSGAASGAGSAISPRLALAWQPVDRLTARLAFGRAFRAPTFEELYTRAALSPQLGIETSPGDDALRPVHVTSAEGSLETALPLGEGTGHSSAAAFWNELDDPIDLVPSGSAPRRVNRDGMRVLGLEATGAYLFAKGRGRVHANVSWQRAVDLEQRVAAPLFALLTEVPQLRSNFGVTVPLGEWLSLSLLAQFGAERRQNARSPIEASRRFRIPAYGLFSASLRTAPILDHFELAASLHNVTDLDLADDVPRPDRMPGLLPREGVHGFLQLRAGF